LKPTLQEMVDAAEVLESTGTLFVYSAPQGTAWLVCKMEGHSWEKSVIKGAIRCSRCGWTVDAMGARK